MSGAEECGAQLDATWAALPEATKRAVYFAAVQAWPVIRRHAAELEALSAFIGPAVELAFTVAPRLLLGKDRALRCLLEAWTAAPNLRAFCGAVVKICEAQPEWTATPKAVDEHGIPIP